MELNSLTCKAMRMSTLERCLSVHVKYARIGNVVQVMSTHTIFWEVLMTPTCFLSKASKYMMQTAGLINPLKLGNNYSPTPFECYVCPLYQHLRHYFHSYLQHTAGWRIFPIKGKKKAGNILQACTTILLQILLSSCKLLRLPFSPY